MNMRVRFQDSEGRLPSHGGSDYESLLLGNYIFYLKQIIFLVFNHTCIVSFYFWILIFIFYFKFWCIGLPIFHGHVVGYDIENSRIGFVRSIYASLEKKYSCPNPKGTDFTRSQWMLIGLTAVVLMYVAMMKVWRKSCGRFLENRRLRRADEVRHSN